MGENFVEIISRARKKKKKKKLTERIERPRIILHKRNLN